MGSVVGLAPGSTVGCSRMASAVGVGEGWGVVVGRAIRSEVNVDVDATGVWGVGLQPARNPDPIMARIIKVYLNGVVFIPVPALLFDPCLFYPLLFSTE